MTKTPTHLEEVPEGGPSYQDMAKTTDQAVFGMMIELRAGYPGLGGAIMAGTVGGLTRYQLQSMPDGTSAQQVLEVLAPIIRNVAAQIVTEQRIRAGRPEPKLPVVAPQKIAFDKLTAALASAPFSTYCIAQPDGRLLLISSMVATDGVLTHGSIANLEGATYRPEEVIHAHCRAAAIRWKADADLLAQVKAKAADARAAVGQMTSMSEDFILKSEAETLDWVANLIENPKGDDHGQA